MSPILLQSHPCFPLAGEDTTGNRTLDRWNTQKFSFINGARGSLAWTGWPERMAFIPVAGSCSGFGVTDAAYFFFLPFFDWWCTVASCIWKTQHRHELANSCTRLSVAHLPEAEMTESSRKLNNNSRAHFFCLQRQIVNDLFNKIVTIKRQCHRSHYELPPPWWTISSQVGGSVNTGSSNDIYAWLRHLMVGVQWCWFK